MGEFEKKSFNLFYLLIDLLNPLKNCVPRESELRQTVNHKQLCMNFSFSSANSSIRSYP